VQRGGGGGGGGGGDPTHFVQRLQSLNDT